MDTICIPMPQEETLGRILTVLNEYFANRRLLLADKTLDTFIHWLTDWADDCEAADTHTAQQALFAQFSDDLANRLHHHRVYTQDWQAVGFTQPDSEIHTKRRDELSRITARIARFGKTLLQA